VKGEIEHFPFIVQFSQIVHTDNV